MIKYPYGIRKEGNKFVLEVKVYGLIDTTYSSESLELLIDFYNNNKNGLNKREIILPLLYLYT